MTQVNVSGRVTADLELKIGVNDCPYVRFGNGNKKHMSES